MTAGTLGIVGEHDWLTVTLTADQAYLFTISGLSDDAEISVGLPSALGEGTMAATTTFEFDNPSPATLWFTPTVSGAYYVDISDPGSTAAAGYSVTAVTEPNDFPDNTSTTGVITVNGGATAGKLGVVDEHDWLAVTLTADQAYLFTVSGLSEDAIVAVGMPTALGSMGKPGADGDGTLASTTTFEFDNPSPATVWFTPAASGSYYVDISDPGQTTAASYSVTAVTEANDFPDNTRTTGDVTVNGGTTAGKLGVVGEHDWLAVTLTADQAYLFTVSGLSDEAIVEIGLPAALGDGTIASTTTFEFDNPSPATLWFTPTVSGAYYVDIADPGGTAATGYSVTAVTETNDFPDTTTTTGVVTVNGGTTTGKLGVLGEHDWLAVTLTADQAYLFTVAGLSDEATVEVAMPNALGEGTTASTTTFEFYNGTPATTWFTPTVSGAYYVDISDPDRTTAASYSATAQTETNDFPDDTRTTGVVTVNGGATAGTLGVLGEHDWLAVTLTADQAYLFTISGLSGEAAVAVGKPSTLGEGILATTTASEFYNPTPATVWFTPTASGAYYVDISDPDRTRSATYSVTAVTETNDFPDNTSTAGMVSVACYRSGTRIATPEGERRVETLAAGDPVLTASGVMASIRWVGRRKIDSRHHPVPNEIWPVRILADAFGPHVPSSDLWLSPDHAVFVDGILIPIKHLINGLTIVQTPQDEITYYHVELERHDILLAEGLPCESYLDSGNRAAFENGTGFLTLHPTFAPLSWDHAYAALVETGPQIVAVRQRLFARAGILECRAARSLRVRADQQALEPETSESGWRYTVPPGTRSLRLISQHWTPAFCRHDSLDRRVLGVRLFSIAFDDREPVDLESPFLFTGFHPAEETAEGPCRWTDGDARLVVPAGASTVTIRCEGGLS